MLDKNCRHIFKIIINGSQELKDFVTDDPARLRIRIGGGICVTEYLVLLKLDQEKILKAIKSLRGLPEKPSTGVNLQYLMNIFGTWDVAMWFNAENSNRAVDFVQKRIGQISGVVDSYTVPTFPNRKLQQEQEPTPKIETPEKTEASEE